ncbi:DUF5031 domain-containing protein [Alistipes sp.]|uniref:DUF5031 domain-containing protein n=1 Tax=Alistipes sp. TaxID=1872444 RepID=UPI003AF1541A
MKRRNIYRIFAPLCLLLTTACTQEGQEECVPCKEVRSVDVRLAKTPVSGLATPLYIFRRSAGTQDEYRYDRSFESVADGQMLKLPLAEMKASDYRFLMIAQPEGTPWLGMQTAAGTAFAAGDGWNDLRLACATGEAASDGYCGYIDMGGEELLQQGRIQLTLTRVAGQVVFDIFRMAGSLSQPQSVVSADVESVIDRVSKIVIEYDNPTTVLRFGADGVLTADGYASEPFTQTIEPEAVDFKVSLPQADKGLQVYRTDLRGSLRIEGAFLLPSDSQLQIRMTFDYYDTTPICGNDHTGDHVASCFTPKQLQLFLPASTAGAGLPVAADCFTVNRAGLRCDRIIDVPVNSSIEAEFGWLTN